VHGPLQSKPTSAEQLEQHLGALCKKLTLLEQRVSAAIQPGAHDQAISPPELVGELRRLLAQLQLRSLSTYHACAAIAEIARAGLERDYPGNPYLTSIETLAAKEDNHGVDASDMFATCEQILAELVPPHGQNITLAQALAHARWWLSMAREAVRTPDRQPVSYYAVAEIGDER